MEGTLTGSGWQVIDGNLDPKRGYEISDTDDAGDPCYFGYLNTSGRWVIMKQNVAAKTFRYCAGKSDYTTAWSNRASLTYSYVDTAFKGIA